MKTHFPLPIYAFFVILLCITSCATPIAPTGGPGDQKGPELLKTVPESGTTNFKGRSFEFHFDEFVNRGSVERGVTVEPDLGITYDLSWRKKRMTLTFEEKLPDSTTVIIKLGNEITDTHNNKISGPVTLAVSTGNKIDSGSIRGRILQATDGKPVTDQKVLLYRSPIDLSKRANYEAQTDTGGYFTFKYLANDQYKAIVVDDRNRNKIWDPSREAAHAFYSEFISLKNKVADTLDVVYILQADTLRPSLMGVGMFSEYRLRLRFNEAVMVDDSVQLAISDSLGTDYTKAWPLFISPKEPFVVMARSEQRLEENREYQLKVKGITDIAGNEVVSDPFVFEGSSQEDTTRQRIIRTNGDRGMTQRQSFKVTYAAPITSNEISDSLVVIEGDVDFDDWPAWNIERNILEVAPQGEWIAGVDYQFLIWNPKTNRRKIYEPQIWDSTEYGEIELKLEGQDSSATYVARLLDDSGEEIRYQSFNEAALIGDLPAQKYTLILFEDRNGNGEWDRGAVNPYRSPERYYVQSAIQIQQGFTSEISISFN